MNDGFVITNPNRNRLAAVAAKSGLKAIKLGMRLNSAYTPKRCREVAEQFTGRKFKARDYDGMIAALQAKLDEDLRDSIRDQLKRNYGEAALWALETSCVVDTDYAQGYDHVLGMILPALEEELSHASE